MKPIFSIVTPSYNDGEFIERTIASALSQKGDFYLDYVIQDGGSKDDTVSIIKKYENLLKKNCLIKTIDGHQYFVNKTKQKFKFNQCLGISYRWESKKDHGQVDALLTAFSHCWGNYFNWLNSDDVFFDENTLEIVRQEFQKSPQLELVSGDGNIIDEKDNVTGQMIIKNINVPELLYLDYHVLQPSTFFTQELYFKYKKYLRVNYYNAFDADFFTHIFLHRVKYIKISKILSCFRIYPQSKTVEFAKKRYWEQMMVTLTMARNPFLIILSFFYRYLEIIVRHKIKNFLFQSFFRKFRSWCYVIVTGEPR